MLGPTVQILVQQIIRLSRLNSLIFSHKNLIPLHNNMTNQVILTTGNQFPTYHSELVFFFSYLFSDIRGSVHTREGL